MAPKRSLLKRKSPLQIRHLKIEKRMSMVSNWQTMLGKKLGKIWTRAKNLNRSMTKRAKKKSKRRTKLQPTGVRSMSTTLV